MRYTPGPTAPYRVGRHPARCNRRVCQARRTLSKHPALYRKWPRCKCGGKVYVDWYRLKKGPYDNAPVCKQRASCPHPVPGYIVDRRQSDLGYRTMDGGVLLNVTEWAIK